MNACSITNGGTMGAPYLAFLRDVGHNPSEAQIHTGILFETNLFIRKPTDLLFSYSLAHAGVEPPLPLRKKMNLGTCQPLHSSVPLTPEPTESGPTHLESSNARTDADRPEQDPPLSAARDVQSPWFDRRSDRYR